MVSSEMKHTNTSFVRRRKGKGKKRKNRKRKKEREVFKAKVGTDREFVFP